MSVEIGKNINVTRIKGEILKERLTLCEQRDCKFILLKLDGHVRLFGITENSHKNDGIVLSRSYANLCLIKIRDPIDISLEKSGKVLSH